MEQLVDFKLEIDRVGRRYRARVRKAPAGRGARAWVTLPAREKLEDLRTDLVRRSSGDGSRHLEIDATQLESATNLGLRLFQSIFHDQVLESWHLSRAQAQSRLRLRLSLDDDPYLLSIPWELLFDPDLKDFVATVTPVVRSLDVPVDQQRSLAGPSPLRILTVLSCPADCAPLEVGQEWNALDGVLGGSVELRSVPPRLEEIDQALQTEEWHVLHFVGHGHADDKGGALILEDREGGSRTVDHLRLGKFLGHPSLRLVVLNACDGGTPGRSDPFSGVAQALLRKGIPAVVAMQQPISDKAAIAFARELYGAIAGGLPLDDALVVARKRMYRDFETTEWAIPVLYLNAPDGVILASEEQPPSPPPSPDLWKRIALITAGALLLGWVVWMSLRPPRSPEIVPTQSLASLLLKPLRPASENPPDCRLPGGLEIAFVRIDAGTFEMGDSGIEGSRPVHEVTITDPFCLSAYEVTQELWNHVLNRPALPESERFLPVRGITFNEVEQFFEQLNKLDPSGHYRLPSEAEWEMGARAGTKTRYSFGQSDKNLYLYGNCKTKDRYPEVAPVGQLKENPAGLFDVHGNISEWVSDWHSEYRDETVSNPPGPDEGKKRVRRGGNWTSSARSCSSGSRSGVEPERENQDTGFRIVREIRKIP